MLVERLIVGMLKTNCYIVVDEKTNEAAVVDPGEMSQHILNAISRLNVDVKYIILTHSHFDHICAAAEVKAKTGAKLVVHQAEKDCLKADYVGSFYPPVKKRYKEVSADIMVNDGDVLKIGDLQAKFINTPGHTIGSCVIAIDQVLFTGDTLMKGVCGRCDLPSGSFDDMINSLKKIYNMNGDYKICPGHSEESTLSEERNNNPYMREAIQK